MTFYFCLLLTVSIFSIASTTPADDLLTAVYNSICVVRVKYKVVGNCKDLIIYNENSSAYAVVSIADKRAKFGKTIYNFDKEILILLC